MKRPVIDYRKFRLSRLNAPEFEHLRLLGCWIVYFIFYGLTENLIPAERCHVIHCALDDVIPFNEFFLIFYCYWFLLIVISLLFFLLYDIPRFKRLQTYIMLTQIIAMIVYIVYPSVQNLRPAAFARDNALTRLMSFIYQFDTPTGVCPSLHVAYSIAIASEWCHGPGVSKGWKVWFVASAVLISLSTMFVKQHSAVDVLAALPMCGAIEALLHGKLGGMPGERLRAYLNAGPTALI